jgi:hypothetical protein
MIVLVDRSHRLPSQRSVLGVVRARDAASVRNVAHRLESLYSSVPHLAARASCIFVEAAAAGVVVLADRPLVLAETDMLVWGEPLTGEGRASDSDLARVLDDPQRARQLRGVFVLARLDPVGIRLVSSAAFTATLRRSHDVVATRALAALVLAGKRPRVAKSSVADAVALRYVLGDGEVFEDVRMCDDACVFDVSKQGMTERSYFPLAERLQSGPPLEANRLVGLVRDLQPRAMAPDAQLALTGGRDSVLVAAALAASGRRLPTFTMGWRGTPDVEQAAAVAAQLNWPHAVARSADAFGRPTRTRGDLPASAPAEPIDWLVGLVPWSEGLTHPREAFSGWLNWSARNVLMVTGHGGEIGRAFYDHHRTGSPQDVLLRQGPGGHLEGDAHDVFAERVRALLDVAETVHRPEHALDLFYALGRMRRWVGRGLPLPQIANLAPVYLEPTLVAALLDTPPDLRASGAVFDEALDQLGVREIPLPIASRYRLRRSTLPNDLALQDLLLEKLGPDGFLAEQVLGSAWWLWATENARSQGWVRELVWAAIGIEAAHRWCESADSQA